MFEMMKRDVRAVFRRDPAARSYLEVLLCYPGLHALWLHRPAHWLWRRGFRLPARLLASANRFLTNVDIHPGACLGPEVFIDHGAGVVIGETSVIGEGCLIYQGAVLGGTSLKKERRHPTLGRRVEIGAGAIVLGPIEVGECARIGAGSVVIRDVPPGATVIGVPGRVVMGFSDTEYFDTLQHAELPDPVAEAIRFMLKENEKLEARLSRLENADGVEATVDRILEDKKQEILAEFSRSRREAEEE